MSKDKVKQHKKVQNSLLVQKTELDEVYDEGNDDANNDEPEDSTNNGYCHFNENGSNTTFSIDLFGYHLTLNQNPDSNIGHGAVVWDAAVVFSKYIEHNPSLLQWENKNVIELGSGCGLAGLSLMLKGAIVTMTDLKEVVEELTVGNVERIFNQVKSMGSICRREIHKPRIYPLDWTTFPTLAESSVLSSTIKAQSTSETEPEAVIDIASPSSSTHQQNHTDDANIQQAHERIDRSYDVILLTDCIFSILLVPYLIQTLLLLSTNRTEIICCHEIRDEDANKEFIKQLKVHYTVKIVASSKLHPDYQSNQIQIINAKLKRHKS